MNQVIQSQSLPSGAQLLLVQGDLTTEQVDAIVNAANRHLQHGGGVAGAIVRAGGRQIQDESDAWVSQYGPVAHASPAHTSAGRLPCRYVIHAVGPVWGEGDEDRKLQECVRGSLETADRLGLASISLPAISTGIFGFPKERAARIMLSTIKDYLNKNLESRVKQVRIVLFDHPTLEAFRQAWDQA